jgi:hypothetical protein
MAVTLRLELLRREPAPEADRILVLNVVATPAQAKGAARSADHEGGQTGATVTKTPSALPSPTAHGVDRLYLQLVEIHAIIAAQLVECTHWRQSDPTSSLIRDGTDR